MNIKILKKARKRVKLLTPLGEPADYNSKIISVVVLFPLQEPLLLKSTEGKYYGYYKSAQNRQRLEILNLARDLRGLPWWKYVFY